MARRREISDEVWPVLEPMMTTVLESIHVRRAGKGRPRTRPDRVLADKGYPLKANRAWLRQRGIAMRTDKLVRNYRAVIALAATLIWLRTSLINTN